MSVRRQIRPRKSADHLAVDARREGQIFFGAAWQNISKLIAREDAERTAFNRANFTTLADFARLAPRLAVWRPGAARLPLAQRRFVLAFDGDQALSAFLPAGTFTHALSDKLNGTLRSPVLIRTRRRSAFMCSAKQQRRTAGVEQLPAQLCQLRYLTSAEPKWLTFNVPADAADLRTFAELMTMFDNPKFPDQLAALGGDKRNLRIPWEQAAANPRSFFGVTHVVLHDEPAPPKADLGHLRFLFKGPAPANLASSRPGTANGCERPMSGVEGRRGFRRRRPAGSTLLRRGLLRNRIDAPSARRSWPGLAQAGCRRMRCRASCRAWPTAAPAKRSRSSARGDCLRPGDKSPDATWRCSPAELRLQSAGSGRRELANLIASTDNPLTARVMVNRIWHHLFGTGIVRSVDNFGHLGDLPSHPGTARLPGRSVRDRTAGRSRR